MSPLSYYQGCAYQHDGRWIWVRQSLGGIWQRRPVTAGWRAAMKARTRPTLRPEGCRAHFTASSQGGAPSLQDSSPRPAVTAEEVGAMFDDLKRKTDAYWALVDARKAIEQAFARGRDAEQEFARAQAAGKPGSDDTTGHGPPDVPRSVPDSGSGTQREASQATGPGHAGRRKKGDPPPSVARLEAPPVAPPIGHRSEAWANCPEKDSHDYGIWMKTEPLRGSGESAEAFRRRLRGETS